MAEIPSEYRALLEESAAEAQKNKVLAEDQRRLTGAALGELEKSQDALEESASNFHIAKTLANVALTQKEDLLYQNQELEKEATTDPLTGLLNRRGLIKAVTERTKELPGNSSVLFADVDNFKSFNTRFGHNGGDAALRAVAEVLQKKVRKGDLVARWGGEELVIYFSGSSAEEMSKTLGKKIEVPFYIKWIDENGQEQQLRDKLTLSGGLADVNFEAGTENVEKELIRVIDHEANKAMFQAKKNGKNQIVIFQNKSAEKEENLTNQVA